MNRHEANSELISLIAGTDSERLATEFFNWRMGFTDGGKLTGR